MYLNVSCSIKTIQNKGEKSDVTPLWVVDRGPNLIQLSSPGAAAMQPLSEWTCYCGGHHDCPLTTACSTLPIGITAPDCVESWIEFDPKCGAKSSAPPKKFFCYRQYGCPVGKCHNKRTRCPITPCGVIMRESHDASVKVYKIQDWNPTFNSMQCYFSRK